MSVEALFEEHRNKSAFRPFAAAQGIVDVPSAYDYQSRYVGLLSKRRGVGCVGYKIGLTSARMQEMCGINSPIAGVVLADVVVESGATVSRAEYGRLGLEFEIAVRMARTPPALEVPHDSITVAACVDAVAPAIELVDDRNADYSSLDILSLVADNSWNAGVVLGQWVSAWPELDRVSGVVTNGGAVVDRGTGGEVLGHPFNSLAWLANHLAGRGETLRAGDIVMTGSLVRTRFAVAGDAYAFNMPGLGSVGITIAV